MEPVTKCEEKADAIFERLVNDINSLKQIDESKNEKLQLCSTQLQTKTKELNVASQKIKVKAIERETLRNMLSQEKIESVKKTEKIKSLTEELKTEKEKTNQMEQNLSQIRETYQKENDLAVEKADKLEKIKKQLSEEKAVFLIFLSSLKNEVNFQEDCSINMTDNLFRHIQEKIRAWETDRLELQKFRKGIEEVVLASTFVSSKTPVNTFMDGSIESKAVKNETNPIISTATSTQDLIKKKEHGIDKKFNKSYAHRCICGKVYKRKESLITHIRTFTENLQFYCDICNVGFLHKYGYSKHLKSAKCMLAKDKQRNTSLHLPTMPTRQPFDVEVIRTKSSPVPISGKFQQKKLLCPENNCNASFLELATLKRHLEQIHSIVNPYAEWGTACKYCGKLLKDFEDFKQHWETMRCAQNQYHKRQ